MSKKEEILKTALRLFAEKGFKDTPMSELSMQTGAAEGTIFYHFKNKEDILLTILENARKEITGEFERCFREKHAENGQDMLERIIAFYLELTWKMKDYFLLLHRHYPYQLAESNHICKGHIQAIYNCLIDIFEQAIGLGQKDGSIRELPTRKAALLIFSMVNGMVGLKFNDLCDIASLNPELVLLCRRIFSPDNQQFKQE